MPEFSGYAAGVPCWVDLGTPDVDASVSFYGELFGWETDDLGEEAGGYRLFRLNGKQVAGVGPVQDEQQPPAWTTYMSSDDADATVKKVDGAGGGGEVTFEPRDSPAGRFAGVADPQRARFSVIK